MSKSIVFVSGDFNARRPGHHRLLRFAAEPSDRLVVAINADDLRRCGRGDVFIKLQGHLCGARMELASPFAGFIRAARCAGHALFIVDRRTRYPIRAAEARAARRRARLPDGSRSGRRGAVADRGRATITQEAAHEAG